VRHWIGSSVGNPPDPITRGSTDNRSSRLDRPGRRARPSRSRRVWGGSGAWRSARALSSAHRDRLDVAKVTAALAAPTGARQHRQVGTAPQDRGRRVRHPIVRRSGRGRRMRDRHQRPHHRSRQEAALAGARRTVIQRTSARAAACQTGTAGRCTGRAYAVSGRHGRADVERMRWNHHRNET
jgi:hypothetical protein